MIGPALPVAFCKTCGSRLEFEVAYWGRATGWRCHCTGCIDGETHSDGTQSVYVKSGEGESPWDALEECAAYGWDCSPEELLEAS